MNEMLKFPEPCNSNSSAESVEFDFTEKEKDVSELMCEKLTELGLDDENFFDDLEKNISLLINLSLSEDGEIQMFAKKYLFEKLLEDTSSVSQAIFSVIDYTKFDSVKYVTLLGELHELMAEYLAQHIAQNINEPDLELLETLQAPFADAAHGARSHILGDSSANYFTQQAYSIALFDLSFSNEEFSFKDPTLPFKIAPGCYALLTPSGKELFILEQVSPEDASDTNKLLAKIVAEGRVFSGKEVGLEYQQTDFIEHFVLFKNSKMNAILREDFSIEVNELSIKEQLYFLNYFKNTTAEQVETMKKFTSLYGVDGMRTFLSLERGNDKLGDYIVSFGQHDEVAGKVFKYYGELLDKAEKAEKFVQEAGCEGEHCVQLAEQVRENIINRAQKDLETAVRSHDPGEVAAKIETYVADAKVYVALLQETVQKPLESIPATEISEEEKEQIRALSARNYVDEPGDFQRVIRSGLETAFESGNTRFYIERDDSGKVIFCDRFDDKVDTYNRRTVKYFGSVNAEPAFNGIGRVRITETLEQELANGETMFAHCDPENAVSSLYIEHGFVATGTVSPAGKFSFEIWRSNGSSEQLQTKSLSTAELLEQFDNQSESDGYKIRKVESGDQFPELGEGKYLTRYFRHNGEYYAVFEPAPTALLEEFVSPQEQKEAA